MMKGWTKLLTKKELRHLRVDAGCRSFDAVERTMKQPGGPGKSWKEGIFTGCWECLVIGRKLGLIPKTQANAQCSP